MWHIIYFPLYGCRKEHPTPRIKFSHAKPNIGVHRKPLTTGGNMAKTNTLLNIQSPRPNNHANFLWLPATFPPCKGPNPDSICSGFVPRKMSWPTVMSKVAMPKLVTMGGRRTPIPVSPPQIVIWRLRYLGVGLTIKPFNHLLPESSSPSATAFFFVSSSGALLTSENKNMVRELCHCFPRNNHHMPTNKHTLPLHRLTAASLLPLLWSIQPSVHSIEFAKFDPWPFQF